MKRTCPHCRKPGIPYWRVVLLGPAGAARCRECGRFVSIPAGAAVGMAILISAFFLLYGLRLPWWVMWGALTGLLALVILPEAARVPLTALPPDDARATQRTARLPLALLCGGILGLFAGLFTAMGLNLR